MKYIIYKWFIFSIKLDKPSTFIKLKESLTSSILKIKIDNYKNYFIYAYNKEIYKKIVKSHQNIKNQRFIRNKKRHLKYATL